VSPRVAIRSEGIHELARVEQAFLFEQAERRLADVLAGSAIARWRRAGVAEGRIRAIELFALGVHRDGEQMRMCITVEAQLVSRRICASRLKIKPMDICVLEAELAVIEPPIVADVGDAIAALANFGWFWDQESDPAERNKILRSIFESVTVDDGMIVSVTPRDAFLPCFHFGTNGGNERERRDSNPRPPA
jgi:hypothetical protein